MLKSFFSWCNEEGITRLNIPLYKAEETVKETYTDAELKALLKKPNTRKCVFSEYRNWVIVNLLLNNGCRAATIRNIKNRDVDLENKVIYLRHTKNKKAQVIPRCDALCGVLREYMRIRGGELDETCSRMKTAPSLRRTACGAVSQTITGNAVCKRPVSTFSDILCKEIPCRLRRERLYPATAPWSLHLGHDKTLLRYL